MKVLFSGGLDILFGKPQLDLVLPKDRSVDVNWLLGELQQYMVDPRHDMFLLDNTVYVFLFLFVCFYITSANMSTRDPCPY